MVMLGQTRGLHVDEEDLVARLVVFSLVVDAQLLRFFDFFVALGFVFFGLSLLISFGFFLFPFGSFLITFGSFLSSFGSCFIFGASPSSSASRVVGLLYRVLRRTNIVLSKR